MQFVLVPLTIQDRKLCLVELMQAIFLVRSDPYAFTCCPRITY